MDIGDPAPAAKPAIPPVVFVYLAIVVATWSLNWPLMKIAIRDVPPLLFVLLRLLGSLLLIAPALIAGGQGPLPRRGERWGLLWIGLGQVAGFMLCSIIGLSILPAGRAIVLAYTMPLWAIPIGLFLWPEPLGRRALIGAVIGFAGLLLFMNPALVDWTNPRILGGNALLLLAAILWALASCYYRRRVWQSPFWVQTCWQLLVSVLPVAALVYFSGTDRVVQWSAGAVAILVYNAAVSTALGYFLWSKALSQMPAAMAGQVMTLTPVGGFILSLCVFGGAITADVVASIVLIVAGICVTLSR